MEARDGYDRALTILDRLTKDNPKNPVFQNFLAYCLRGRGLTRLDLGDFAGVAADTRRSLEIWEKMAAAVRLGMVPDRLLSCRAVGRCRSRGLGGPTTRSVRRG